MEGVCVVVVGRRRGRTKVPRHSCRRIKLAANNTMLQLRQREHIPTDFVTHVFKERGPVLMPKQNILPQWKDILETDQYLSGGGTQDKSGVNEQSVVDVDEEAQGFRRIQVDVILKINQLQTYSIVQK